MNNVTPEFTEGWLAAEQVRSQTFFQTSVIRHKLGAIRTLLKYEIQTLGQPLEKVDYLPTQKALQEISRLFGTIQELEDAVERLPYWAGMSNEFRKNGELSEAALESLRM